MLIVINEGYVVLCCMFRPFSHCQIPSGVWGCHTIYAGHVTSRISAKLTSTWPMISSNRSEMEKINRAGPLPNDKWQACWGSPLPKGTNVPPTKLELLEGSRTEPMPWRAFFPFCLGGVEETLFWTRGKEILTDNWRTITWAQFGMTTNWSMFVWVRRAFDHVALSFCRNTTWALLLEFQAKWEKNPA